MKIYKFLDVGCKIGGSFGIANKYGYSEKDGLGIDINEDHVKNFINHGYDGMVADASDLPFEDNFFELTIFSHVLEHLPNEQLGKIALEECLRVSSKYVFLALPFFDEDDYLNSLGLKTYYSDWSGHKNMVHLKKILNEYLVGYKYDLNLKKKINDSTFSEILPKNAEKNSHHYDETIHGPKEKITFDRDIWREYTILIHK